MCEGGRQRTHVGMPATCGHVSHMRAAGRTNALHASTWIRPPTTCKLHLTIDPATHLGRLGRLVVGQLRLALAGLGGLHQWWGRQLIGACLHAATHVRRIAGSRQTTCPQTGMQMPTPPHPPHHHCPQSPPRHPHPQSPPHHSSAPASPAPEVVEGGKFKCARVGSRCNACLTAGRQHAHQQLACHRM